MRKLFPILALVTAVVVALGAPQLSYAETDLENKKSSVDKKLAESNRKISAAKDEVQTAEEKVAAAQARLESAKGTLAKTQGDLTVAREADAKIAVELEQAEADLKKAEDEVKAGQQEVETQRELIGKAVKEAYQQQSDLVGVSVILGSDSSRELASRIQWQDTVLSSTAAQLERLQVLLARLEAAQQVQAEVAKTVAEKKEAAAAVVKQVRTLVDEAQNQTRAVAGLVQEHEQVRQAAAAELAKEEEYNNQLAAESSAIQAQIKAELAARLKAEADAAANNQPKPPEAAGPSSSGLLRPVDGRITSNYGWRANPFNGRRSWHSGTDFGNSCGTPIKAAASGVVKMARWNGGYGNYIRLDNGTVGGKATTTAYGHLSGYAVSAGQRVEQGQTIGYVGTTGSSTGCHLHFEVWVNGETQNPMSYV